LARRAALSIVINTECRWQLCVLRYGLLILSRLLEGITFYAGHATVWQGNDWNFLLRSPVFGSRLRYFFYERVS
jgi:hypothetical protein